MKFDKTDMTTEKRGESKDGMITCPSGRDVDRLKTMASMTDFLVPKSLLSSTRGVVEW
jgi:hypothetical protein